MRKKNSFGFGQANLFGSNSYLTSQSRFYNRHSELYITFSNYTYQIVVMHFYKQHPPS